MCGKIGKFRRKSREEKGKNRRKKEGEVVEKVGIKGGELDGKVGRIKRKSRGNREVIGGELWRIRRKNRRKKR